MGTLILVNFKNRKWETPERPVRLDAFQHRCMSLSVSNPDPKDESAVLMEVMILIAQDYERRGLDAGDRYRERTLRTIRRIIHKKGSYV